MANLVSFRQIRQRPPTARRRHGSVETTWGALSSPIGSVALIGVSATGVVGTLTTGGGAAVTRPLTGVTATGAVGTVAVAAVATRALTGVGATGQVGTVGTPVVVVSYALTIAGTTKAIRPGWTIHETANGRNMIDFDVVSTDGTYRPAIGDQIVFTENGIRIFGGLVDAPAEEKLGDRLWVGHTTHITGVDFNIYADRKHVTAEVAAGTMKAAFQVGTAALVNFGVTLDPAQITGPTLPALSYDSRKVSDLFDEIALLASQVSGLGYVWEIDYNKTARMIQVGTVLAPFNIADGDRRVEGDLTVNTDNSDFANYVILLAGSGQRDVADVVGTANGSTATFALHYTPANFYVVNIGGTLINGWPYGGVNETIGTAPAYWSYDPVANTITRYAPPANGAGQIIPTMNGLFPFRVMADSGVALASRIEKIYTEPDVFDVTVAQALADALLVRDNLRPNTVRYSTPLAGFHPGQTQTITSAKRNLSGSFILTDVEIRNTTGNLVRRRVTAAGSSRLPAKWQDTMRQWTGGATSNSGGTVSAGSVTIMTVRPPVYFLGGNLSLYVQDPAPTWTAADAVRVVIDTTARGNMAGTVRVRLRATAGTVTARLQNVTDGTTAGTSSAIATVAWTDTVFDVVLTAGIKTYELQLLPSIANTDVAAVGHLE